MVLTLALVVPIYHRVELYHQTNSVVYLSGLGSQFLLLKHSDML